jgi:sec-independent protein translocase protein TatC
MARKRRRHESDEDLFKATTMTFGEHLEELRGCLWKALLGLAVGFIFGLVVGGYVVDFIQRPLEKALTAYRQKQTLDFLGQLQAKGQLPPGDLKRFEDLVYEDQLVAREAYLEPAEVFRELRRVRPKLAAELKLPREDPGDLARKQNHPPRGIRKTDLLRMHIWHPVEEQIQVTSLGAHEPFVIYVKAALLVGVVAASPWIFYQIWSFVAAGLYRHEKRYVHVFLPFSLGLFLAGAATAFFLVFEPVLRFLLSFNSWLGIDPDLRISEWLGFVLVLPLGFGISFQLPLVMLFLERIGIFDVAAYLSKWRIAILVIFVLAMFLTPADPTSMILMAAPLTVLYFGGVLLCKYMPRSRSPFDELEQDDQPPVAEEPRRRSFSCGLRVALAAVLAVILVFGWLPWKRTRSRRAAVAEIEKLGGTVYYGFQLAPSGRPVEGAQPPGPSLLRRLLGDDFFARVAVVDLSGSGVSDAVLEHLKGLSGLQKLDLTGTEVTEEGLEELRQALPKCKIITGPD